MFEDKVFFLIKMPLESAGNSRVIAEGDNINLTAADVDSFDVAMCGSGRHRSGAAATRWQFGKKKRHESR